VWCAFFWHRIPERFPEGSRALVIDPMLATGTNEKKNQLFSTAARSTCNNIFVYIHFSLCYYIGIAYHLLLTIYCHSVVCLSN
jgi:hypothetical protein